jgi:Uncharacterised protein family (UPF0236)
LEKFPAIGVKKKQLTTFGAININNQHPFSAGCNGFQISPRLQELIVYAGQMDSYGRSEEVLEQFLTIEGSAAQVYRVTDCYGAQIEEESLTERILPPVKQQETLYAEPDGSLVLTREEGYKEVKAVRLFKSSDCLQVEGKQGVITHSQYLAHLGSCEQFCAQTEPLIESYGRLGSRLVFISDGAPWIKNWIEDAFPGAVSILDYYHACEHLYAFAERYFSNKKEKTCWAKQPETLLLESKVDTVIENLKQLQVQEAQKLIDYYETNKDRMNYRHYRQIGCGIIGSGAIESTHRTLVQKRMKLSGQRWTKAGAQNMLHLRVIYMNNQWHKIIELIKTKAKPVPN